MWRADPALARHLALSRQFDAVIEPAEAAAARRPRRHRDRRRTSPLAGAAGDAARSRRAACGRQPHARALGLAPERPAALVQLGSGNNNDIDRHLDHVVDAAQAPGHRSSSSPNG